MADELNAFTVENAIKITIFKMMALHFGTLVCDSEIGALIELGLFFPVVCSIKL